MSVAIGADFESKLEVLRASAHAAGFERTLLWREADFIGDPVLETRLSSHSKFRDAFDILRKEKFDPRALVLTKSFRPYCAAFKMVALWRALRPVRIVS